MSLSVLSRRKSRHRRKWSIGYIGLSACKKARALPFSFTMRSGHPPGRSPRPWVSQFSFSEFWVSLGRCDQASTRFGLRTNPSPSRRRQHPSGQIRRHSDGPEHSVLLTFSLFLVSTALMGRAGAGGRAYTSTGGRGRRSEPRVFCRLAASLLFALMFRFRSSDATLMAGCNAWSVPDRIAVRCR